jgi:signal transduction histidine kinase
MPFTEGTVNSRFRTLVEPGSAGDVTDEMLATLAHELRQPLNVIASAAGIIEQRRDAPGVERAQRTLGRQVRHVVQLLDDLLETIYTRRGALELRRTRLDVREAIEQAVDAATPLTAIDRQRPTVFVPRTPLWLDADPRRLQQILSNLLSNALKHTRDGQRVWVLAEQQGTRVLVTVGDHGDGIPGDALERIFGMFSRVPHDSASGFGVGLAVVKRLTELHGGTVRAFSDGLGRGSRFVVALPSATTGHLLPSGLRAAVVGH